MVGGGFVGISAALYRAAEAGARVVVVEANEVGSGAAGRNAAKEIPAHATKLEPQEVLRVYRSRARRPPERRRRQRPRVRRRTRGAL